MAIVRPDKPPLLPAQQQQVVAAATGGGAAPATSPRPVMRPDIVPVTPENMPLEVMTDAPVQPRAPTTDVVVLPADPAAPQLPTTQTPPGVPPEEAPITEDEVLESGRANSADGVLYGAALAASLGLVAAKQRKQGQIDDSAMVAASNTETLDRALEDGTITEEQYRSVDPATAGDAEGINNIDGSADDTGTSKRPDQSRTTERSSGPDADTSAPDQPTAPTERPDTARPSAGAEDVEIGTDDIVPGDNAVKSNIAAIEGQGFTKSEQAPFINDERVEGGIKGNRSAGYDHANGTFLDRQNGMLYVKAADGSWYSKPLDSGGYSVPNRKAEQAATDALRALRSALR